MFIDTSGFLCRHEKKEPFHGKAAEVYDSAKTRVTTNSS